MLLLVHHAVMSSVAWCFTTLGSCSLWLPPFLSAALVPRNLPFLTSRPACLFCPFIWHPLFPISCSHFVMCLRHFSISPISLPFTPNHITSTAYLFPLNSFSGLNPDTLPVPRCLPHLHLSLPVTADNLIVQPHLLQLHLSLPSFSNPSSFPHKKTFTSQTSLPSSPETLEDIQSFLTVTQRNVARSHPLSNPSIPIRYTCKLLADIHLPPQVPLTPLPPTLSQNSLSSLSPCAPPVPLRSPLSLPLSPGCDAHVTPLFNSPPDPSIPDSLGYLSALSPVPLTHSSDFSHPISLTPISTRITSWLFHNGSFTSFPYTMFLPSSDRYSPFHSITLHPFLLY